MSNINFCVKHVSLAINLQFLAQEVKGRSTGNKCNQEHARCFSTFTAAYNDFVLQGETVIPAKGVLL